QDRAVARVAALLDVSGDALDHEARFVLFVVGRVEGDRGTLVDGGPQLLAEAVAVVRDYRIGGFEDGGGGAVVLLQPDGACARIDPHELLHVLHARAAPGAERLVVVADGEDFGGSRGQGPGYRAGSLTRQHPDPRV